jgi:methanogenic corrinoid protein MtbC1
MQQVGLLWQTDAICPAQEHFITNLVRQKMFCAVDQLKIATPESSKAVVLFLPDQEIHDIGLLMLHYILKEKGIKSVFLGTSVPLEDLQQVQQRLGDVEFVSFFTTHPSTKEVPRYLEQLNDLFGDTQSVFHLSGWLLKDVKSPNSDLIKIYSSPAEVIDAVTADL